MENAAPQISVLMNEVLELLNVQPGMTVVDTTAGAGGHLRRLAEAVGPSGRVLVSTATFVHLRRTPRGAWLYPTPTA